MALFYDCWQKRGATLERLHLLLVDAKAHAETEGKATVDIQRIWRGQRVRTALRTQAKAQVAISRVYRGHLAQQRCKRLRVDLEQAYQQAVVNYYAVIIQKRARGNLSRTHRLDFRKRKAYISDLAAKGHQMRLMLEERLRHQQEHEKMQSDIAAREELAQVTQDLHHLLSTRAVAGIYNSAMQPTSATSFGVPVETHIRQNARRIVTSRLSTSQRPSRLAPYPPSDKATLQATSPYDAVQQESRKQTKYQKLRRISSADFAAVYNPAHDVARKRNTPGINSGSEYLDDWRNPYKRRGVPRTKRDLLPQLSSLGRHPDIPFYLTYGGNKSKVLANDRFDV